MNLQLLQVLHVCTEHTVIPHKMVTQLNQVSLPQIQPLVHTLGYCRFVLYSTLGHMGGGNRRGGYTLLGYATTRAG